jgi:hypothetical protein
MQYYLLETDVNQLTRITIGEYFGHVANGTDGILVIYNPLESTVSSIADLSSYWFHDFNGKLESEVHTSEEDSDAFVERFTDYGRDLMAMYHYKCAIHNNLKYYPREIETRDCSNRSY